MTNISDIYVMTDSICFLYETTKHDLHLKYLPDFNDS